MALEDRELKDVSHSPFGREFERYENYNPDLEEALSILYKADQVLTDNGFEVEDMEEDFYFLGQDKDNWPERLSERMEPVTPIKESDVGSKTDTTQEGDTYESRKVTTIGVERYSLDETPNRLLGIRPVDFIINYLDNGNSCNLTVPRFGEDCVVGINTQLDGYSVRTKEDWSEELVENREIMEETGSNKATERHRKRYLTSMKEAPRKEELGEARENAVDRVDEVQRNLGNYISFNPDKGSLMFRIKPDSDLSSISDDFDLYSEMVRELEDLTDW